jgi:hypothetical protein
MTYSQLVEFCGNERQAWFLSQRLPYQNMTQDQLVTEVLKIMCRAKERIERSPGRPNITLQNVGGHRRDTLR